MKSIITMGKMLNFVIQWVGPVFLCFFRTETFVIALENYRAWGSL